jgi:hypothetical protein
MERKKQIEKKKIPEIRHKKHCWKGKTEKIKDSHTLPK